MTIDLKLFLKFPSDMNDNIRNLIGSKILELIDRDNLNESLSILSIPIAIHIHNKSYLVKTDSSRRYPTYFEINTSTENAQLKVYMTVTHYGDISSTESDRRIAMDILVSD